MAYGTTQAGTLTKEQTQLSIRRLPVAASTTITKGNVIVEDAGGDYVVSGAANASQNYVALETVDNSAGADSDLFVPVAVPGHYVTVIADGVIRPGEKVMTTVGTAGQVITHAGDDNLACGIYFGKEGGTIAKGGATPFLESFTDDADFDPVNAADGDVIEILVLGN
jgi:hypothetical protein